METQSSLKSGTILKIHTSSPALKQVNHGWCLGSLALLNHIQEFRLWHNISRSASKHICQQHGLWVCAAFGPRVQHLCGQLCALSSGKPGSLTEGSDLDLESIWPASPWKFPLLREWGRETTCMKNLENKCLHTACKNQLDLSHQKSV